MPDTPSAISPSSSSSVPILVDFINTVPASLTTVLIGLAPYISYIRHGIEIASWTSPRDESWLALAAWWFICLLAETGFRYLLPIAILFTLAVRRWTSSSRPAPSPVTEHNLETILSDLTTIRTLLPTFPDAPESSPYVLLRVSAILYVPYLILTHIVRLRVLLALVGTVFLSWRAPWACLIRRTLVRSAWLRWTAFHAWARLTGVPLPQATPSFHPTATSSTPVDAVRFLFTVYENQRWWMGLDWTAALLPGERPSWCSASQHAVSPPSAFALPAPTTVYLDDGHGRRVRRTASWCWEEGEWRVVVRKDGSGVSRVERPLPEEAVVQPSGSGSKLLKAAGMLRTSGEAEAEKVQGDEGETSGESSSEDLVTDADGWVYGDNKWENPTAKGGIGKYTRYRRWTRIAVLSEVVESVEPGELGVLRSDGLASIPSSPTSTTIDVSSEDGHSFHSEKGPEFSTPERGLLRQRLKAIARGPSL